MPDPFQRFSGSALWARLPAEQQAVLGAVVLELGVNLALIDRVDRDEISPEGADPVIARAAEAGMRSLDGLLRQSVAVVVPVEVLDAQDGARPFFPSLLGGICRSCGCTQNDACDLGCSWVAEDLCSTCVPEEVRRG